MNNMRNELAFLKIAENLKKELRHSWLSDGRQESVADHSWRLSLMALRYAHKLAQPVSVEKCLKMAIVHDLAEAITGDIPLFDTQTQKAKAEKFDAEYAGMMKINSLLSEKDGDELFQIWDEYEKQSSYESQFIKALDKLEAFIQHNEAPESTWEEREKRMLFQDKWLRNYCQFDPFLNDFCTTVIEAGIEKLKARGESVDLIRAAAKEEELGWDI